jgi:hypothetical protein
MVDRSSCTRATKHRRAAPTASTQCAGSREQAYFNGGNVSTTMVMGLRRLNLKPRRHAQQPFGYTAP